VHFRFLLIVYEGIRTQEEIEKRFKEFVNPARRLRDGMK
jgi:hypothetical protein